MTKLQEINEYSNIAIETFNQFKPLLIKFNNSIQIKICYLTLNKFGLSNLSEVVIYINSIYNNYYKMYSDYNQRRNVIITFIINTVIHELLHVEQYVNANNYNSNPLYANNIEDQVKYLSWKIMIDNKKELESRFNFNFSMELYDNSNSLSPRDYNRYISESDIYQNILLNMKINNDTIDLILSMKNVKFTFIINSNHYESIIIKEDDKYVNTETAINLFSLFIFTGNRYSYFIKTKMDYGMIYHVIFDIHNENNKAIEII